MNDRISALERRVAELARSLAQRPVWTSMAASSVPVLFAALGSDVLSTVSGTDWKGIGITGTVPVSVPQADPSALVTFPAMLGKARLGDPNTGTWVWVATQCNPGTGATSDTLTTLPNNQVFTSWRTIQMPIAASSSFATVYLPWEF